jgi:hypothetical protein
MEKPSYFSCDEVVRGVESSYAGSSAFAPRISKGARVFAGGVAVFQRGIPIRGSGSPKSPIMTVNLLSPGSIIRTSLHHTGVPCSLHAEEAEKIKSTHKKHNSNEYPTRIFFWGDFSTMLQCSCSLCGPDGLLPTPRAVRDSVTPWNLFRNEPTSLRQGVNLNVRDKWMAHQ